MTTKNKFALSDSGIKHHYSDREREFFSCLSEQPISSREISNMTLGKDKIFGMHNVIATLNNLEKKILGNREGFVIRSTKGKGPRPKMYWLERVSQASARRGEARDQR